MKKHPIKNTVALLLAMAMLILVTGCATPADTSPAPAAAPAAQQAEAAAEAPETPAEPAEEPEEEPVAENALNIEILLEQDDAMINTYSLIAVNDEAAFVDANDKPVEDVAINATGAKALIDWMLSSDGAARINDFGYSEYGEHLFYLKDDRPVSQAQIPQATDETKRIRLSTTTSVNDSGLLNDLLPAFEQAYGYEVEVASAGTGKAIAAAKYGNADLILVHSKSQEEAFVEEGYGKILDGYEQERLSFMYNYFVLVGPKDDPAKCAEAASVKEAFAQIAEGKFPFVSRGDKSGTHTKEVSLWPEELGITAEPESIAPYTDWYISSNAAMGTCLTMANEKRAYLLSDKATYLTFAANGGTIG